MINLSHTKYFIIVLFFHFLCTHSLFAQKKVLIFTKNGEGFVHDNVATSAAAFEKIAQKHKFKVDITDDAQYFTEENLNKYRFIIFSNTNNEVFESNNQRLAFRRYIQSGGGMMGIHSALGTERDWEWFKQLLGGSFIWHPKNQPLQLIKISNHSSVSQLPANWSRKDECYFSKEYYPGIQTLIVADLSQLDKNDSKVVEQHKTSFGNLHPVSWYNHFDGGTSWITTLGHDTESYTDPLYLKHIEGGFKFLISETKKRKQSAVYAKEFDSTVVY